MARKTRRICILGGGFGGLYTALRLSRLPWGGHGKPHIILIDRNEHFLFSPLLYELVSGELREWEIAPRLADVLDDTGIRFRQAEVERVDVAGRSVKLAGGEALAYDHIVLALGGGTPTDAAPGAARHALPFRTLDDARRLNARLRQLEATSAEEIRVAVVGGGYSGVELACKIADRLGERGRVGLIELASGILRPSPDFNRATAGRALESLGISLDLETRVSSITAKSISLERDGRRDKRAVDLVLWTVGTCVAELVRQLPLERNEQGQLIVTPTMQVVGHPEMFALGDLAACVDAGGTAVPATAQAAFQQAEYAGWNLWASITGGSQLRFRYAELGEMMTLGTANATFTGLGIEMSGALAHLARRMLYLYRMPSLRHQFKVGLSWMAPSVRDPAQIGS